MTRFEQLVRVCSRWWFIIGYIALLSVCIVYIDKPIAHYFKHLDSKMSFYVMHFVTRLGLGGLYIGSLFLLAVFFRYIRPHKTWELRCWFLWLSILFASLVCIVLKVSLGRARPDLLFLDNTYGFFGFKTTVDYWSFPSGHTTTVMSLMFGLAALFPRYCCYFIFFGLFIVFSRVMLTYHYLSDVLAASYLALLEVGLLERLLWKRWHHEKERIFTS